LNHYSHPKAFYFWNCLDALITLAVAAVVNGLLYPVFFKVDAGVKVA
jgi:hypothetical protein